MSTEESSESLPTTPPKSSRKLILAIAAAVLLVAAAGAAFFLLGGSHAEESAAPQTEAHTPVQVVGSVGPMMELGGFVVNIMGNAGTSYLKTKLTLELANPEIVEVVRSRMPLVSDSVIKMLSSRSVSELSDLQGKLQLQSDLLARLNDLLGQGAVRNIYYVEFVIQ